VANVTLVDTTTNNSDMRGTDSANTIVPPTTSQIASAILSSGDVDGYSLEETLKLCLAVLAGKISGAGTGTITIRSADDSRNRIVATTDNDGNRLSITLDEDG
jgi:mevalonate kinase